jgi:hypothetical protein
LEWKDPDKIWVGSGNPCGKEDMALFYAATTITIGNGRKTPFWHAPWLEGRAPIDIAPLIFEISKRKKVSVAQALLDGSWVRNINLEATFEWEHLSQFLDLWVLISNVLLHEEVDDEISWKLTENGQYTAASAYKAQFLGLVHSDMNTIVWKAWAPPKGEASCLACTSKSPLDLR